MIDWNSPRDTELNILKILEEYTQNRWKTMKESVKNEEMRRQSKKKLEKCKELNMYKQIVGSAAGRFFRSWGT